MKRANFWIVLLLLIGLAGYVTVEGYVLPKQQQKEAEYQEAQADPVTHDFTQLLPYKGKYMGNASTVSNLNYRLPLNEFIAGYQLYPDELTAEIKFQARSLEIDQELLPVALMYNSIANFVLIDNLEVLHFTFDNTKYIIAREKVEKWLGIQLETLQEPEEWEQHVRSKVKDEKLVDQFMKDNVILQDEV